MRDLHRHSRMHGSRSRFRFRLADGSAMQGDKLAIRGSWTGSSESLQGRQQLFLDPV